MNGRPLLEAMRRAGVETVITDDVPMALEVLRAA